MSSGISVLHVDDDPSITELTATFLQREYEQISVRTATSADEGLQLLAESEMDCIVSDYQMPGMNGIEFLEIVAEDHPNLPFILYTGKGSEEVASEAIRAGVTDYLQKESGTDHYSILANRIVHAVDNQRRERRIEFLQKLQKELTELSIEFLRTEERDIDTLIDGTLEKLGTLVDADRTYVFDIDHEADTISNTHEWCSEGVEPQIDMLQDLPQETLPWWMQRLENFEKITIPNVSDLPPEAEAEQEILQEQNIESLVVTPMILNDELVGFIGFDWVEEQEAWSDEFIDILRMVSELITTARKRGEREQELKHRSEKLETLTTDLEEQYRHLFEEAPVMAVVTRAENGRPVIEDCNDLFVETLGCETSEVVGVELDRFYTAESQRKLLEGGYDRALSGEFVREKRELVTADGETVETLLRAVPREDTREDSRGTLAFYIDISERRRLERQRDRLEGFTSIVSHDLRNPLTVADRHIEFAKEECDSDHLTRAADAIDRSRALIDDLLTLAREGEEVTGSESVALAEVAQRSWETVETRQATLETDASGVVKADRSRLQQLFENLYRNAVEHGGDGVTVHIGELNGGFYVADTGSGIPEGDRDEIFDAGYSTADHGTGFGLRIVERIAGAHGWDIAVTESEQGGARFEFTGVERVD